MHSFHLTPPDYVVVAGYFGIVLWVGFYFRGYLATAADYFAGGHQVPWWMAGISHYMSTFSAFSFIAYAQIGYSYGWVAVTLFWVTVPACVLGGLIFARRWRRARIITPVEFLESRFSALLRQIFAWAGIPMKIFDDALKIFATGLFISLAVGLSLHWAIIACGIVMVAYTFLGGLWALIVTDFVQFLMKALAILLLLPLALWKVGGIRHAFTGLPAHFLRPSGGPYGWIYIAGFLLLIAVSYNGSWALAQKYYSVKDERSATKAAYFSAFLNLIGAPVLIIPSLLARKFLPDLLAAGRTADVYVMLVLKLLPAGMIGIIIAAMFSATMATVSADFNSMASVLTQDVYFRLINPRAKEAALVSMGRLITLVLGAVTVILGLWIAVSHQQSLFHLMVTVFGLLIAPALLPLLAGLTVRSLTTRGALAGFVAGLLTGIFMLALKTWWLPSIKGVSAEWANYTFEGISILVNIGVTALAMWLGTVCFPADAEEQARIRRFFAELDRPIAESEVQQTEASPLRAIGVATMAVGVLLAAAGLLSISFAARTMDVAVGACLVVLGFVYYHKGSPRDETPKSTHAPV
ncbi:MAG: sodium/solute symporter [Acidobacteriota bacterium]|nr:sodium/solute symporter [Acidobacteriota bacterium]